jgi:hypothetical protein
VVYGAPAGRRARIPACFVATAIFFGWRRAECAAKSMGRDQQRRHPVLRPIAA